MSSCWKQAICVSAADQCGADSRGYPRDEGGQAEVWAADLRAGFCGEAAAAVQTPIAGLQIADTCFYYPEDRGIAESVRLGQEMGAALGVAG